MRLRQHQRRHGAGRPERRPQAAAQRRPQCQRSAQPAGARDQPAHQPTAEGPGGRAGDGRGDHSAGPGAPRRARAPRGEDGPYEVDDNKIYAREEAETGLAVRDEIVAMVVRRRGEAAVAGETAAETPRPPHREHPREAAKGLPAPPRTGVEIVEVEERDGGHYYTMRDLR